VVDINRQIAEELGVREQQVEATVALLDGGATVPFVARYRKEITGALDDAQLRTLEERLNYLRELEERRIAILNSIREQGRRRRSHTSIFRRARFFGTHAPRDRENQPEMPERKHAGDPPAVLARPLSLPSYPVGPR
jgi:hypothetical protein